jgi:hypothetical protein
MKYNTPGFSLRLIAIARKPKNLSKAIYNVFIIRNIDAFIRRIK